MSEQTSSDIPHTRRDHFTGAHITIEGDTISRTIHFHSIGNTDYETCVERLKEQGPGSIRFLDKLDKILSAVEKIGRFKKNVKEIQILYYPGRNTYKATLFPYKLPYFSFTIRFNYNLTIGFVYTDKRFHELDKFADDRQSPVLRAASNERGVKFLLIVDLDRLDELSQDTKPKTTAKQLV